MPTPLIYDELRGFRTWHISQIYEGSPTPTSGNIVPNVGDMVVDWDSGFYKVIGVDAVSRYSTLKLFDPTTSITTGEETSVITGLSGYQPGILNRVFYDDSSPIKTLTIDTRYLIYGSAANSLKLFLGTDISPTGTVISQRLNGAGAVVSENIQLQTVIVGNNSIKRPNVINTGATLETGELVTAVIYDVSGNVTGTTTFVIVESSAIRASAQSTIYIDDITLLSPLLDPVETDLLKLPAGVPFTASSFNARLHYSNGDTTDVVIDGNKTKLLGLDDFNVNLAGATSNIVLAYYPDPTEAFINGQGSTNPHITRTYRVQADNTNLDYGFKLYLIPHFVNAGTFTVDVYVSNLARDIFQKLDPNEYNMELVGGGAVALSSTGASQHVRITFSPSDVFGGGFGNYVFAQQLRMTLRNPTVGSNDPWIIDYVGDGSNNYGAGIRAHANNAGAKPISLTSGNLTKADWLDDLLEPLHPIYNPETELSYPEPTHFKYIIDGVESPVYTISNWGANINRFNGLDWDDFSTVAVVFLKEANGGIFLHPLGAAPMLIRTDLVI